MGRHVLSWVVAAALGAVGCAASGPDTRGTGSDGGADSGGTGLDAGGPRPGVDSRAIDGGTTRVCGPDASVDAGSIVSPGDCTTAGPVPGCACGTIGETHPCRTGRMITCDAYGEFGGRWGPCLGDCFSTGTWAIDNLSPCFITYGTGQTYAVSTVVRGGAAACPDPGTMPPPARPAENWSTNRLTVDCEGQFRLCYTLRAGDAETPSNADCVVAEVCTEGWYAARNVTQELSPLESWVGSDPACAARFASSGGYGEMSVIGTTLDCEVIDDDRGGRHVFNRVRYCPLCCNDGSCSGAMCERCMMGGSGSF